MSKKKLQSVVLLVICSLLALLLAACGDSPANPTTGPAAQPTNITQPTTAAPATANLTTPATTAAPTPTAQPNVQATPNPTQVANFPVNAKLGDSFQVRINQPALIGSEKLEMRVLRVLNDSRCPTDPHVSCASAGRIQIELQISQNGQNREIIKTSIPGPLQSGERDTYGKYNIKFLKAGPDRKIDKRISPEEYIFDLRVTDGPAATPTNAPTNTGNYYPAQLDKAFVLSMGEKALILPDNLEINLVRLVEDTRCPTLPGKDGRSVACAWAGEAVVEIEMNLNFQKKQTLKVSSIDSRNTNTYKSNNFDQYRVQIVKVWPEKAADTGKIPEADYSFELKITNTQNPVSPTPATGLPTVQAKLNQPFKLKLKQSAQFKDEYMFVKMVSVVADQRCPANVKCVTNGPVTVKIEVIQKGDPERTLTVSMPARSQAKKEDSIYNNYNVAILQVAPARGVGQDWSTSDYEFEVVVSKVS